MAEAKKTTTGAKRAVKPKAQPVAEEEVTPTNEVPVDPAPEEESTSEPVEIEGAKAQQDETAHEHAKRSASSIVDDEVKGRWTQAKGVLYTDGLSGDADLNLERAYEFNERLQSNNPAVRRAGDESLSESAKEARDERDSREAEQVINGERL